MSPSESELRAALHEGEGDQLDATALIARAHVLRHQRQRRIHTALGVAAAVVVIGGGVAGLVSYATGDQHTEAGGSGASIPAAASGGVGGVAHAQAESSAASRPIPSARMTPKRTHIGPGPAIATQGGGRDEPASCAGRPNPLTLPSSGADRSGALFTRSVARIRVCAYAPVAPHRLRSELLGVQQSVTLARTLEAMPVRSQHPSCSRTAVRPGRLELHAVDANGHRSRPVVVTVGCGESKATNGVAVRFVRTTALPQSVLEMLAP